MGGVVLGDALVSVCVVIVPSSVGVSHVSWVCCVRFVHDVWLRKRTNYLYNYLFSVRLKIDASFRLEQIFFLETFFEAIVYFFKMRSGLSARSFSD